MKLLILQGLPASGKSTYAKELVHKGNWKRVNKDDLRDMMDNYQWSPENEKFVLKVRDYVITQALKSGFNVVVDDCNLNPQHEHDLRRMILKDSNPLINTTEIGLKFFSCDVKECIARDKKRGEEGGRSVGAEVIEKMAKQLKDGKPKRDKTPFVLPAPYAYQEGLPDCILVDIDGTVAHMTDRTPHEYEKVDSDVVDPVVRDQVILNSTRGYIIMLSGRPDSVRDKTTKWLLDNGLPHAKLFMRKEGDRRPDFIVKAELFDEHIRGKFNVRFALDDRNQVANMYRRMGITVLQVADGDF